MEMVNSCDALREKCIVRFISLSGDGEREKQRNFQI
jgi:hypothetical protein